jgi:hypothetical protein
MVRGGLLSAVFASLLLVNACSSKAADNPDAATPPQSVDPQVFSDVVEAVLKVPGETQRRGMRVETFIVDLTFQACGQDGPPLDSTGVRFSQDKIPILSLIAEKGFVEDGFVDKPAKCDNGGPVIPLPHFQDALNLRVTWTDVLDAALQDERLTSLRPALGSCLTRESSLQLSADVPNDFLRAVDEEDVENGPDVDVRAQRGKQYAKCAGGYFDTLTRLLLKQRPEMIERNRELLTEFASDLVAAGYVP